jgi:hypothetical protein
VPSPPPLHDLACVAHLHSTHSDGTGTVAEIAAAAAASAVDVVLLTDHDTLGASDAGEEGHHGDVLVLVGEEVSPPQRNHYLAFGLERAIDHRGLTPAGICRAVEDAGGFGFAAHPFSRGSERFSRLGAGMPWGELDAEELRGIELWSFVTDTAERLPSARAALRFLAAPGRYLDHPPEGNLAEWDRMCASRRVVALGGLDAHQIGVRVGGRVPFKLMSYKRSFRHLRTHVLADEPLGGDLERDRELVYAPLREGRSYLAVDSVAPADGFRFWAERPSGDVLDMGSEAPFEEGWELHVLAPRPARLRLLRDGEEVAAQEAPALVHRAGKPGVYRVEARLQRHGRERTWVLSNPIYLR